LKSISRLKAFEAKVFFKEKTLASNSLLKQTNTAVEPTLALSLGIDPEAVFGLLQKAGASHQL